MEVIVKCIINIIGFTIFFLGLSSIIPFLSTLRSSIKQHTSNEFERKIILETVLTGVGLVIILSIVRWKLPTIVSAELLQNFWPRDQYIVAIIGHATFDMHYIWFYCALIGFIYRIKQVQYGGFSKNIFVRKSLLPILAVSMLCTLVPFLLGG